MGRALDILYGVAGAATSPIWGWRLLRTGKWRTDWAARFAFADTPRSGRSDMWRPPTLLVHAVSVGEVNAIRLLVEQIEQRTAADARGPWRIVISSTTDTGIARARSLFEPRHTVVRFPFDFSGSVGRFLRMVQPDVVALVELEVWPNFLQACRHRRVPVCVINGRLSQRSFRGYRWLRPLLRSTFATLAAVGAQTETYARRFVHLGVPAERVSVLDTMKWDNARIEPAESVAGATELAEQMGIDRTRPLIVAGSTGPGEEKLLIDTCPPEAQLLLAPRKPERFNQVARLDPTMVRRTAAGTGQAPRGRRLFLLDTIGELRQAYALADVCLVGRSFLGLYGSDMMEPIGLGKPTIIGPHHADFEGMVTALRDGGGLLVSDRPGEAAAQLLADRTRGAELAKRGREVILARQGATRRYVDLLLAQVARPAATV